MRLNHSDKVKMARRLLTQEEIKNHVPIFDGYLWRVRKTFNKAKVFRQQNKKKSFAESLQV